MTEPTSWVSYTQMGMKTKPVAQVRLGGSFVCHSSVVLLNNEEKNRIFFLLQVTSSVTLFYDCILARIQEVTVAKVYILAIGSIPNKE